MKNASEILKLADQELQVVSMADDRASCGEWAQPVTPADYLMWIEDEVEMQREIADFAGKAAEEITSRNDYAERLDYWAKALRAAGVVPSMAPWNK